NGAGTIVSDDGEAQRGREPGQNGDAGGRGASLNGAENLADVAGIQTDQGNLVAGGIGDHGEVALLVDGDATGSGVDRGGNGAAVRDVDFLQDHEIRDVGESSAGNDIDGKAVRLTDEGGRDGDIHVKLVAVDEADA